MESTPWWQGATPHNSISHGKVNEALFEAKLGEAIQDRGPDEYRLAEKFFEKTFFTAGLRRLLLDILHTLSGRRAANAVVNLKTSFGGGKTHTELAVYHLLAHPEESMRVPEIRALLTEAGLTAPPPCRIAVLPGTNLSPTGRKTADGLQIRTLWGEMAYRLGGPETFALVAEEDARLISPGEDKLRQALDSVGPSLILLDETLHYVDKASDIESNRDDLAKQTVAFLRELTGVVDSLSHSMMVVSLTASRMDQLSPRATDWLERMEHHVNRLAHPCTPIEGTEIHEVVRRRLFEKVDENAAVAAANHYHQLYAGMAGLPGQYVDVAYRDLMRRSYPFHPELITVIYERWGAKPGFQLTRSTLRFLALALQDLWLRREKVAPDLIRMGHVSAGDSAVRAMIRDIAGDPQWESVIGSDIAAPAVSEKVQPAKAELIDQERGDGLGLARSLATTILLYSVGGGEHPEATRQEIRLACARHDVNEATWDDLLEKFRRRLFYLYYDEARYQFRKEPNVTSLHHTYRVNIGESDEVDAHVTRIMETRALGSDGGSYGFTGVSFLPKTGPVRDSDDLKLLVLGFDHPLEDGQLPDETRQAAMEILERDGQEFRKYRNTLIFCAPDKELAERARELAADYLSWRKIQQNAADWDRIGGAQQELVKTQLGETEGATLQAITSAYNYALVPIEDKSTARLALQPVPLGTYGPGKYIAPMVWDSLTAKISQSQWLLKELTPQTFLERYGRQAWPETEKYVTTAQLWERFTTQVGLPILTRDGVLLEMLRQGVYEGLLAIGLLVEAADARNERDSYVQLYFKEMPPTNTPIPGERWIVMRPEAWREIAEQPERITAEDILEAVETLRGSQPTVSAKGVYQIVKSRHPHGIDNASYVEAVQKALKENRLSYKEDGQSVARIDVDDPEALAGEFFKEATVKPPTRDGRTIVVRGSIDPSNELSALFKKVIQPLNSQSPSSFTMELTIRAQFDEDPGGGLDAILDDAFDKDAFPGLKREDSKGDVK